jgi:UDP-N-acetylmuramoyl-tripeptide--D-alanyl-D-alanine ligase
MAELGDYSGVGHEEVAQATRDTDVDLLVAVGAKAKAYGGRWVATPGEALAAVREELRPGDCILIKGARALELESIADALALVSA